MTMKISSTFLIFFLSLWLSELFIAGHSFAGPSIPGPSRVAGLQNVRCLLLLIDGEKQCWRSESTNSLPKGVPIKLLGLRPRQGGSLSVGISSVLNNRAEKSFHSSFAFEDVVEIPKEYDLFEFSILQKDKVIFKVPFRTFSPKFYYAVIGVNGQERVLENGSKIFVDRKADFKVKEIKTNLHRGVSVKVAPRSSREDEFQVHYGGEIIGRMYFQKRGNL
jgi:hypothetical protein